MRNARFTRRANAAIALLCTSTLASCGSVDRPPPNIILIVIDSLRADYLGSQGFEGDISPHLDRFAAESVTFSQCMSQAPWTKPSIASLFTSTYPTIHGMTSNLDQFWHELGEGRKRGTVDEIEVLSPDFVTLAEALQDAGYTTSARSDNPWLREKNGYAQGFDRFSSSTLAGLGSPEVLLEHIAELRQTSPYFLYLHFMVVHAPYRYDAEHFAQLSASPSLGSRHRITAAEARLRPVYMKPPQAKGFDADELRDWKASYATGVTRVDARLGALFDGLALAGSLDDTVVVVTSDHGEEFLEHGQWEHGRNLCNHQLHVPLMIRLPGAVRGGTQDASLARLIDLMPTLLTLAQHEENLPQLEGRDLFEAEEDDAVALASAREERPSLFAAQTRTAKLIWDYPRGGSRFFDLSINPEEVQLHEGLPEDREARKKLESSIRALAGRESRRSTEKLAEEMSEEELEQFRALGYIQ